jgi:hypothetical protein
MLEAKSIFASIHSTSKGSVRIAKSVRKCKDPQRNVNKECQEMSGLEEAMVLLPIIKNDVLLNLFA